MRSLSPRVLTTISFRVCVLRFCFLSFQALSFKPTLLLATYDRTNVRKAAYTFPPSRLFLSFASLVIHFVCFGLLVLPFLPFSSLTSPASFPCRVAASLAGAIKEAATAEAVAYEPWV